MNGSRSVIDGSRSVIDGGYRMVDRGRSVIDRGRSVFLTLLVGFLGLQFLQKTGFFLFGLVDWSGYVNWSRGSVNGHHMDGREYFDHLVLLYGLYVVYGLYLLHVSFTLVDGH